MSTVSVANEMVQDVRVVRLPVARRHRRPPLAVLGLLGWLVAAAGVESVALLSHGPFRGISPALLGVVKIVFIIAIGAVFARAARGVSPELVVATGLCWLVLSIAADLVATSRALDPVHQLLGDPAASPKNLRALTILAWLAAPALFARRGDPRDERCRR
jgi:hypothetical protein